MTDDPYVYSNTGVLRNKLGIQDAAHLEWIERALVSQRIAEGVPGGQFDLAHLQAIHRHLFQDVYDWAGEIRTVELAKGGHQFQLKRFIDRGMADIRWRLSAANYLQGLSAPAFVVRAGEIIGDLNYVHPFREGNGRTQLQYLKLLAAQAGHPVDLTKLEPASWLAASRAAHMGNYDQMAGAIAAALMTLPTEDGGRDRD